MNITRYLLILTAVLLIKNDFAVSQAPQREDYWGNFLVRGSHRLQNWFFNEPHPINRPVTPDSRNLGSNIVGYDMGRFGLHSLMWGHLTWVRSPEYSHPSTTDATRSGS